MKHDCHMRGLAEFVSPESIASAVEEIQPKEISRIIHNRAHWPLPKQGESLLPLEACEWCEEFEPVVRAKILLLDDSAGTSAFTPWHVPFDIYRESLL